MKNLSLKSLHLLDEIIKTIARCGVVELKTAISVFKTTENKLDDLCAKGFIKKEYLEKNKKVIIYYIATKQGKEYIKEKFSEINDIYNGFIIEHDLRLSEFYLQRSPEERETWMTRDELSKKSKTSGKVVDGVFVNQENELEAIEVISSKANPSTIEDIEKFIETFGIKKMNYILY